MAATRRFDRITLDAKRARRRAADGALIVPGLFARTGLQTYTNADGTDRIEYRSRDEVLASAPSFEGVTITDRHPADFINPSNWASLSAGHAQNIRAVDGPDGEAWLEADFVIGRGEVADAVEQRRRSELSAGYFCDAIDRPGTYRGQTYLVEQGGIVGNHIAVLGPGEARAGRGARLMLDSNGQQLPPDDTGARKDSLMKLKVTVKGVDYEVEAPTEALAQAIAQERADSAAALATARADADAAKSAKTAAEARADAAEKKSSDLEAKLAAASDPARIDARASERAELTRRATVVAGKAVDAKGSDHEIRLAALAARGEKVLDDVAADRKADATYLEAYTAARFDASYALHKGARESVRPVVKQGESQDSTDDPIAAALKRNQDRTEAARRVNLGLKERN